MPPPVFGDYPRIDSIFEPLYRKAVIPELAIEELVGTILPRFAGLNERRADSLFCNPRQHLLRGELMSMIRSKHL
jgi:hypothetical protein